MFDSPWDHEYRKDASLRSAFSVRDPTSKQFVRGKSVLAVKGDKILTMIDYNQKAKDILVKIQYATVATVTSEGKPWNSPVAHEIDENYVIYWFSDKENQHSKNVRANPHAFIVIYDSTAPEGEGEGVYIEADVEELNDAMALEQITNAKGVKVVENANEYLGDAVRRCYKATPKRMWMNDAEMQDDVFVRDYRVELDLLK